MTLLTLVYLYEHEHAVLRNHLLAGKKLKFAFSYIAVTTVLGLEEGKDCIIVGTLYKHMKLKPSILDEYSKEVI